MNNEIMDLEDVIDVIEEVLGSGGEFRLHPRGSSMLPLIVQGRDWVVLARRVDNTVRRNDIAFYRRDNGQFVLHRVMRVEKDGTYTMCGDHQCYLEQGIRQEQVIGYVKELHRNDKKVSFRSLRYRLYTTFWNWMLFRRGCFYLKRKIGRKKES